MRHHAFRLTFVLSFICLAGVSFITARGDDVSAGVATIDITPPVGYRLSGYFSERVSTGTHDPLLAKALYVRQDETEVAIVTCDLIGISREVSQKARAAVKEKSGIPVENIVIAATHSHTGPLYAGALREHFHFQAMIAKGKDAAEKLDYSADLVKKLTEVIAKAKAAAQPVSLYAGYAEQQGLSFNRRFHMKDGSVVFNPGKLNPNIVRVAGPIDPEVGLIALKDAEKKPLAAMTTFALHLDTVGGTEYAADFPLYLSQALQKKYGDKFVSLFAAGTCGDINHIDVSHDRPQKGHEEAKRIGDALGETVLAKLPELVAVKAPELAVGQAVVNAPLQRFTDAEIAQARKDIHKVGAREPSFLEQVKAVKIVSIASLEGGKYPLEVQVIRLSSDVALVALPGEVFVDLGLAIKTASPFETTIVMELCNDSPAYIPTKKAFAEGSYETVNSRVQSGGGEMMVEAATKLLTELYKSAPRDKEARRPRPVVRPAAAPVVVEPLPAPPEVTKQEDAPKVEPKKQETPPADVIKPETDKPDAPKQDPPKPDLPEQDAPKQDAAKRVSELDLLRAQDEAAAASLELARATQTFAKAQVELDSLSAQSEAAPDEETRRRWEPLLTSQQQTVQLAGELVEVLAAKKQRLQLQAKELQNQSLRQQLEEAKRELPAGE